MLCSHHACIHSVKFLMKNKGIIWLYNASDIFFLSGLELTFFSGVYGTCIAQNKHFKKNRKGLLGISGMLIGAGEIIGQCHVTLFSTLKKNGICQWFVSSLFACVYVLLVLQFICLQCTAWEKQTTKTFWNKLIIIMWS